MKSLLIKLGLVTFSVCLIANESLPKEFKTLRKGVPYGTSKKIMEKKGWIASNTVTGETCDHEWKEVCCEKGLDKCTVNFTKEEKTISLHLRKDTDKKQYYISEDFKQ